MKIFRATRMNLMRWRDDPKYAVVAIFTIVQMWQRLGGLSEYAELLGTTIHPWVFPFLMHGGTVITPLLLAYVILIVDAPFRNRQQRYVLLRTGKRTWLAGQIVYQFILSLSFSLLILVCSIVFLIPKLSFSLEWGDFLTTISLDGLPRAYGYLSPQYSVIRGNSALEVTIRVFTTFTFSCFLLSMIVMLANLWLNKSVGAVIAMACALMPSLSQYMQTTQYVYRFFTWISPFGWADMTLLGDKTLHQPSYLYALLAPIILSGVLVLVAMLTIHKCDLDTNKE